MFRLFLSAGLILFLGSGAAFGSDSQKLFGAKCAKCHGKDGKGVEKLAKTLKVEIGKLNLTGKETVKATDAALVKVTLGGRKKMPKFQGKLSPEEVQGLVQYLRTLSGSSK